MSICCDDMPKTRSKVKGALPSFDCPGVSRGPMKHICAAPSSMLISYIDRTAVIAREVDYGLSSICQLDFVLRSEAGDDCILRKPISGVSGLASDLPLMLLPPAALALPLAVLLINGVRRDLYVRRLDHHSRHGDSMHLKRSSPSVSLGRPKGKSIV